VGKGWANQDAGKQGCQPINGNRIMRKPTWGGRGEWVGFDFFHGITKLAADRGLVQITRKHFSMVIAAHYCAVSGFSHGQFA
jgi:hypothetical protein